MNTVYAAVAAAAIGLFYIAAPHSIHVSSGLGFDASHTAHMVFGASLLVLAGVLYVTRQTKLRFRYRRK